ncbi:MAG: hypothetical protein N3I35_15465 [Clostridia bacterium]|nr:hypothetical protein [Clostridia bacterium]
MKKIYLLLTQVDSLIMRGIRLYTGSKYNHIAISIDSMKSFYTFGRKLLYFPLVGGFIREQLNKGFYRHFKNVRCLIFSLEIEDADYDKLNTRLDGFIQNSEIYKYNLAAFFGIVIKKPIKMRNRYTCSEFTAMLLQESGIYEFSKDLSLIIPEEFCSIPGIVRVFEGKMSEFVCDSEPLAYNVN